MQLDYTRVLSFNAGFVDTACFLALHGVFAAHITGNFVTLAAGIVTNEPSGTIAKILALPVFCIVVFLIRFFDDILKLFHRSAYNALLQLQILLFAVAAIISFIFLPFPATDTPASIAVALFLIAAMAIQNAMQEEYWHQQAPTTVMTGATVKLMLKLADYISPANQKDKSFIMDKIRLSFPRIIWFCLGCILAGIFYKHALSWIFVPPFIVMLFAYRIRNSQLDNSSIS
ncbi:YoaK family protein [Acinetobacter qingfengensis]|uniref:DUF1275 domain-containing protein n=1 Tax=Acinetobacter qingfengensis TaxID=1262585 RepID=A0A1E7R9G2_9GAMM|nr:YoaK family protein [Acinetobacter qingfengensis]OEY95922.1 hypothetical protein BJI46_03125 [Acinetobacter qingfengensis]